MHRIAFLALDYSQDLNLCHANFSLKLNIFNLREDAFDAKTKTLSFFSRYEKVVIMLFSNILNLTNVINTYFCNVALLVFHSFKSVKWGQIWSNLKVI